MLSPYPYDSASEALFSSGTEHLFKRDVLGAWLWDMCGIGGTFSDVLFIDNKELCDKHFVS